MKKFLALVLSTILVFNPLSVSAGTVTVTGDETLTETSQDIEVTMDKGATFVVALPKSIELNGEEDYELKAGLYAEIDELNRLVVEPIDAIAETTNIIDFKLVNIVSEGRDPKPDIIVEVTPVNTTWEYDSEDLCDDVNDIVIESNQVVCCTLSVDEAPTGKWKGNLSMRIALEDVIPTLGIDIVDSTNSNNLNGVATYITGETKSTLLNELINSGYILNTSEVNALVNVDCDNFTDTATATFNVKGIAQPGERIVVYHYDEENNEWEYIDTAVVDSNYQIVCEFNSFSPIGFVNIGSVEEDHVCEYTETIIRESTCNLEGVKRFACGCGASYIGAVEVKVKHNPDVDGNCIECGKIVAGLYDANGVLLCTWEESGIEAEIDYTYSTVKETATSPYYIITKRYPNTVKAILPEGMTRVGYESFRYCNMLTEVILPSTLVEIGSSAFNSTGLISIDIPSGVRSFGNGGAFANTPLTGITIPEGVEQIPYQMFHSCTNLTSVVLPSTLTELHDMVFYNCTSLQNINIPSGVNKIGRKAFDGCSNLTSVIFNDADGWYIGDSEGAKTTSLSNNDLSNTSTAATYLKSTYMNKYWTKE